MMASASHAFIVLGDDVIINSSDVSSAAQVGVDLSVQMKTGKEHLIPNMNIDEFWGLIKAAYGYNFYKSDD